jgi:hypothetical protein
MARGWESKAVEAQQDAVRERRPSRRGDQPPSRSAEHDTLMLARQKALADLQRACAPAHRAMLERAIAELDIRLSALPPNDRSR